MPTSLETGGPLLVRIPNWLGDLVLAFPVLAAAAEDPRDVIFVGPGAFAPLVAPRFPGARYVVWSRARRFAALGGLRRMRPGTALLLTDSLSSALLAALAGIPERIGYAAELRGALLTKRVPRPFPARQAARTEEYAALARAAGLPLRETSPRIEPLQAEREAVLPKLAARRLTAGRYAVMAPGASYGPAKRWEPERFAGVAASLQSRFGLRSALVGTREDAGPARRTEALAGACAENLVGETDLGALVGVLAGAVLVLSNDSGVMHLAAALGRPTIGIFGSTSPVWTSSGSPWVRNLYAAYPCSPCFLRTCPIGYGCLRSIETGEAIQAAHELLGGEL